jgi:hypothetical protein
VSLTDLAGAAHRVDARRARSKQKKLGPSAVGGCRRKAAYSISDIAPTDDGGSKMKAILGTWIHKGALDALKREYGALIEVQLQSDMLKGSADAVYLESLTVEDVKTTGLFAYEWRLQVGVELAHLWQVHLYAWLLREGYIPAKTRRRLARGGYINDRVPIEQVVVRYLCRDNGEEWAHVQDYDPKITAQALEWLANVYADTAELGPEFVDRDEDGPGLSMICDGCRWLTACWGPQRADGHSRQANLIRDDEDVQAALVEYDRARAVAKEADAAKKLAREKLDASDEGQYGDLVLGWSGGGTKRAVDMEAVRALFASAGLEVPEKSTRVRPSIGVKLAKPPATPREKTA